MKKIANTVQPAKYPSQRIGFELKEYFLPLHAEAIHRCFRSNGAANAAELRHHSRQAFRQDLISDLTINHDYLLLSRPSGFPFWSSQLNKDRKLACARAMQESPAP